ncbi:MAG: hypothetical protein ACFHHU_01795 [Porticoccaceae bacterium]
MAEREGESTSVTSLVLGFWVWF